MNGIERVLLGRWLLYRTLISVQFARNGPATRRAVAISLLSLMQWPLIALPYPIGVATGVWGRVEWSKLRWMAIAGLALLSAVNALWVFPKLESGTVEGQLRGLPTWIVELAGPLTFLFAVLAIAVAVAGRRLMVG